MNQRKKNFPRDVLPMKGPMQFDEYETSSE